MVLNVHAVMDGGAPSDNANPESSVLPVKLFAADMQMLRDAGYHTVTPEQITAWRAGVLDLPPNALLLTFDDGRTDTVLNAAPILRRVGMRATVFAIGDAWKRSPLYEATRRGAALAAAPGLVDRGPRLGAPQRHPHRRRQAPPLPQRAPQSIDGRLETLAQFRTRAATEYRDARTAAEKIANRPVVAFAWPFGAYGADTRTNDPRVAAINVDEARRVYSLGFNQDGQTSFSCSRRRPTRCASPASRSSPRSRRGSCSSASSSRSPLRRRRSPVLGRAFAAAKWHSRRVPLGALALAARPSAPRPRPPARPPNRPSLPTARPNGQPIVLALTATHPTSAALGSLSAHLSSIGLLSPAWLALEPEGRFAYNAADPFTAGLAQRGARLVPVLADPQPPGRRAARRRPAAAAAGRSPGRGTARARCARHRARLAQPAALGARPLRDLRAASCASSSGRVPRSS